MSKENETKVKNDNVGNQRFIAVDSGKFKTKVALLSKNRDKALTFGFRTMIESGNFADDAIEANTFIAEFGGKTYKIGNGASKEAELETSKKSEIHKITTLAAIALVVNDGDEVNVAIGCPVKEYEVVEKRNEYRDYILPPGEVKIKIKTKNETEPKEKHFFINYTVVYPESSGILYLDMERFAEKEVGIIDIGGGTGLGSMFDNFEIVRKTSFTCELGGNVLVNGLSQLLSAEFSRCNPDYVRKLIALPHEQRKLVPINGDKDFIEEVGIRSKEIIDDYLLDYVKQIRRQCDSKQWPLDYIDLVGVGGTCHVLSREMKQVFGENIYIPKTPEYTNALGFLRRLCAKRLGIIIPIDCEEKTKDMMQGSNALAS